MTTESQPSKARKEQAPPTQGSPASVTDAEVDEFMQEYRDGKHPLSPEFEAALKQMEPKLFSEIRDIINRGKPPTHGSPASGERSRLRKYYTCNHCHQQSLYDPCDKCGNPASVAAKTWSAITDNPEPRGQQQEWAPENEEEDGYGIRNSSGQSIIKFLRLGQCKIICDAHKAALVAAVREAILNDVGEEGSEYIFRLEQQLLSALAAIKDHNKKFYPNSDARLEFDLSALHEHDEELIAKYRSQWGTQEHMKRHDAKVREPLVEALEWAVAKFGRYQKLEDALAKAKEEVGSER